MDTKSITVDASTFEAFLRWQREHGHEVEDEAPEPEPEQEDEQDEDEVPLVTTGNPDSYGIVPSTVNVTPHTGGRYGEAAAAPAHEDEATTTEQDDAGMQPSVQPTRQRSPRLRPATADGYVLTAMMTDYTCGWTIRAPKYPVTRYGSGGWTARGLTAAISANGHTMSVAQVRSALTRLEQRGYVTTSGKCGKQERWMFTTLGLTTHNIQPGVTPITAP